MTDIVDIYMQCGDFKEAVKISGLPLHIAHLELLKSGVLKIQDKINYGNKAAQMGGKAEELFQKLVPDAIDANKYFKKNNPIYDFMFEGLTIDIKFSSLYTRKDGNSTHWQIKTKGDQDFIVAFLEKEQGHELEEPIVLLLPMKFISNKKYLHISRNSSWVKDFQIEPEELRPMLSEYATLRGDNLF